MNVRIITFFACVFLSLNSCTSKVDRTTSTGITALDIQQHIQYLTSEELAGRKPGERGSQLAAEYIRKQFKSYGLTPGSHNGTYFQYFNIVSALSAGKNNICEINVNGRLLQCELNEDFRPMSISSDTSVSGSLVFVGYGISSDTLNYDDYADVDVKYKIVMLLRFTPDYGTKESKFYGYETMQKKAFTAREKGAIGIIVVTGTADEDKPVLLPLKVERRTTVCGLPVVNLKSTIADSILFLAGIQSTLKKIQLEIYETKKPFSFEIPNTQVTLNTEVVRHYSSTPNVIGLLEGSDPVLKDECIVVGAHYDHIGMGGEGSGSMMPDTIAIHPGADDNASGTAGMLELAQYFAAHRNLLKRSVLFIAFSAEEMGILGSTHYTQNPVFPLEKTVAMINLDMIGRMRESTLVVEGTGTSPLWEQLLWKENPDTTLRLKLKPSGFGPSDHASFYAKGIPILFFFTNVHEDYHRPSDVWQKINYEGQTLIVQYVMKIIENIANLENRPQFIAASTPPQQRGTGNSTKASLGIIPDFAEEVIGMKISGTRPNSPAQKAGLVSGDIITKLDGRDVKNIYDFMYILGEYKPGDEVFIIVKRGSETIELKAVLEAKR